MAKVITIEIALNELYRRQISSRQQLLINKLNEGKPFYIKNISTDDTTISFWDKFDDVDEYKSLLDQKLFV